MGVKVNIFLGLILFYGIVMWHFNCTALFVVLSGFIALYKNFKVWKFTNKFPGRNFSNNWKTFFGNSSTNFHQQMTDMWSKHGRDKFITWVGFERFITVSKLNDVQAILSVTEDASLMENYQQMWPWLGGDDVIKTSEFSSQALVNALVAGPFSNLSQSDTFVKVINKRIGAMCQQSISGNDVIDVQPVIRSMAFDVLYGLAMGRDPPQSRRQELFEAGEKLCQLADQQMYSGWRQSKWLSHVLGEDSKVAKCRNAFIECVKKVLNEKRASSARDECCFLDVLVAGEGLSESAIASTLLAFIVLGYDRLSSATCFAMKELSKQRDVADKIRNEVVQNSPVDSQQKLKGLVRLDSFLLESQRLNPAVSIVSKWITTGVPLNGYFVPPNSSVFLYLNGTGREPQRFKASETFDMNRSNLSDTFGGKKHEFSLPMTLTKLLVGNLVTKCRFSMEKEVAGGSGCGVTLRPTHVRANIKTQ